MKSTVLVVFLCLGTLVFSSSMAWAYCSEPRAGYGLSAPQPPGSYEKPDRPDCLSRRGYGSSVLECDDRTLRDYRSRGKRYADKLKAYADEAKEFAEKAERFAKEAADYAACARDELEGR